MATIMPFVLLLALCAGLEAVDARSNEIVEGDVLPVRASTLRTLMCMGAIAMDS